MVPADPTVTPPFLQVVRGDPTAAELAAVVLVLGARWQAARIPGEQKQARLDGAARAAERHEFLVRTVLGNASAVEHDDALR